MTPIDSHYRMKNFTGIINAIPRFAAMMTKYISTILVIRQLNLSEYGTYQELMYYQALLVHLIGLELYFYFNKEYIRSKSDEVIATHLSLVAPVWIIVSFGVILGFLALKKISLVMTIVFILMSSFEYLMYESYRYIIALNRAFTANLIVSLRNTFVLVAIFCYGLVPNKSLSIYLLIHSFFTFLAFIIMISWVLKLKIRIRFRKAWLNRIKPHASLVVIMVLSKFFEFFDKFLLRGWLTMDEYGEYLALSTFGAVIIVLTSTIVYQPYIGRFLEIGQVRLRSIEMRRFGRDILVLTLLILVGLVLLKGQLIRLLFENLDDSAFYFPIILGYSFISLSYIPLMIFFIRGWQNALLKSHAYSLLFSLLILVLIPDEIIYWSFPIISAIMLFVMSSLVLKEDKRYNYV